MPTAPPHSTNRMTMSGASFAAGPLVDKENNNMLRSSSASLSAKSSHVVAAVVSTSEGVRPSLGRDTGPTTLRLGQPSVVPILRFDDARMGGSRTLPLRLENDTPTTQHVRFDKIPRDDGFLVDPDRVSLPPGANEMIRVSWCPLKPSRTVYCGTMHVVLHDNDDGGSSGGGTTGAAALKVRLRGSQVMEGEGAGVPGALSYSTQRRVSTASSSSSSAAAGTTVAGRRSSILQPLNGNAVTSRRRDSSAAAGAGAARSFDGVGMGGGSPGGKRSRADCDRVGDCGGDSTTSSRGGGGGSVSRFGGTNGSSFTSSSEQRRKAARVAPVAKTLSLLRKPKPASPRGASSKRRQQLAQGERPNFEEFHTQFWVGQQERAFTNWLNLTIIPTGAGAAAAGAAGGADQTSSAAVADARARRRAAAAARSRLWQLYSRDLEVRDVILRAERHVDDGRLRLRGTGDGADVNPSGINVKSGGSFMEDVRLGEEFKAALGSYSLFWLRAAVDTILGNPGDITTAGTAGTAGTEKAEQAALVGALMRDRSLEIEFSTGGHGAPPYRAGYSQALAATVLKRTLLLAFLLDRAQAGLPPNTPLLFRVDSDATSSSSSAGTGGGGGGAGGGGGGGFGFGGLGGKSGAAKMGNKSSAAVVRAALQASCHGEGDVLRHLGHMVGWCELDLV